MKISEPKNLQQPLCAANLNQYRSLQRPGMHQKSSFASQPAPQQSVPLKSSMKQPQTQSAPPKVVPPQLPPKNRHKDIDVQSRSQQRQAMMQQQGKGQNFSTLQYPSKHQQSSSTHTTFGYDNKSRGDSGGSGGGGGGGGYHGYQQHSLPEKKHSQHQQQQYESSRMTSFHGGPDPSCGYPMKVSKSHQQGYQTMPHQPKHQQQYQSSKSHGHHSQAQPSKQSKRDDPPVYYRSLQRGGQNPAGGAHNDLYSVTEL